MQFDIKRKPIIIWRQMWGETRGRCEGSPLGKLFARHEEQVLTFGFYRGISTMNRFRYLDFSAVSSNFWGAGTPKKFLQLGFFPWFLGILKDGLAKKKCTRTSLQFSWDFEGTDPPKKVVNPQTYPWFSREFEGTDPPNNQANPQISLDHKQTHKFHWTAYPGKCEVQKALTNCFSSLPLHPLKTSAF